MFREMRRAGQALPEEECRRILLEGRRGVLAVQGDGGYPYALPVNYFYQPEEGTIYLHGGREGHKIDALRRCSKVCFTVLDQGWQDQGDWAWHPASVICFGRAELVADRALTAEKTRALGLKYYPDPADVEREMGAIGRVQLIAVHIEHMTGKRVHEK